MASLHKIKLKNGREAWQLHFRVNGKRFTQYFPHGVDFKLIVARKKEIEAEIVLHKAGIKHFGAKGVGASLSILEVAELVFVSRERDVSAHTLRRNKHGISLLAKFLGAHFPINLIKQQHIDAFKKWRHESAVVRVRDRGQEMDERRISRGINHDLAEIKTVFRVAVKKGIIPREQCPEINFISTDRRRLPEFLSVQEVHQVAAHLDLESRLAFWLIYYTGARRGEIVRQRLSDKRGLKWGQVDLERGTIMLYGKRKERMVPVLPELAKILEGVRRLENPGPDDFVVKLIGDTLTQKFRAAMVKAGITKAGAVHILRHSFATHMLDAGVDFRALGEWLGHSSITSTQIYTHMTLERLQGAARKFSDSYQ